MVDAPISRVWDLIGTPEGLARWFIPTVRFTPEQGAAFYFMEGWEGVISLYHPGRCISFFPEAGGETTFACDPVDDARCVFRLTDRQAPGFVPPADIPMDPDMSREVGLYQPGGPGTPWVGILAGWHCFAHDLVAAAVGADVRRPPLATLYDHYENQLRDMFG